MIGQNGSFAIKTLSPAVTHAGLESFDATWHPGMHIGINDLKILFHKTRLFESTKSQSGYEGICRMIEAGAGIGISPESAVVRHQATIRFETISLKAAWAVRERSSLLRELTTGIVR